jgi:hypothetical protein
MLSLELQKVYLDEENISRGIGERSPNVGTPVRKSQLK